MLPGMRKDCQGELQHAWLSNSAHYPVCSLLSEMWTGVGGKVSGCLKHPGKRAVKLRQILSLGVRSNGNSWRTRLWQSAVSSATASLLAQRSSAICRAMEGVFPGLGWLVLRGIGAGLVACSHTSHFPGFLYTNSTGREGDVLERHWAT